MQQHEANATVQDPLTKKAAYLNHPLKKALNSRVKKTVMPKAEVKGKKKLNPGLEI